MKRHIADQDEHRQHAQRVVRQLRKRHDAGDADAWLEADGKRVPNRALAWRQLLDADGHHQTEQPNQCASVCDVHTDDDKNAEQDHPGDTEC